jgi:hypothetical protein
MKSLAPILLATVVAFPGLAAADDVNEVDAKAIEAKLLSVLASDLANPGVVSVKAASDGYDVVFDIRKALEKSIAPWTVKEASSILHTLRPAAGDRWDYSGQGTIRLVTEVAAANQSSSVTLNIGSFENKGIFDSGLHFVRSGELRARDLVFATRSAKNNLKIVAQDSSAKFGFEEKTPGIGDVSADVTMHKLSETFGDFPNPETRLAGETLAGRFVFENVDFKGIAKLMEFWGGSAKGKALDALNDTEIAALSGIVASHAPFATKFGENTGVDGVSVNWADNSLKIANLSYYWTLENLGGDAAVDLGAKATNLTVDAAAIPPALRKALPKEVGIGLRYSGFKLSAMWAALADAKTVRQSLTTKDYYTRRILPDGKMKASFDGTYVRSDFYDFTLSGAMDLPIANPDKPENADLKLVARDFDKTIKFLQDLSKEDPNLSQVSFTAMVLKGFGKAQADGSILWHVQTDASGKMTVNGQAVPTR